MTINEMYTKCFKTIKTTNKYFMNAKMIWMLVLLTNRTMYMSFICQVKKKCRLCIVYIYLRKEEAIDHMTSRKLLESQRGKKSE